MGSILGDFEPLARIILSVSLFAIVLYFLARPGKKDFVSKEEKEKQRRFAVVHFGIVTVFAIAVIGIFYSHSK